MNARHLILASLIGLLPVATAHAQQRPKTAAPAPAQPSSELELKIEAKLGRPLTADQKQRITKAAQAYPSSLRGPHAKFIQDVARSLNQTDDVVGALIPMNSIGTDGAEKSVVPKLEGKLNRKLNPGEIQRIKALDDARKASLKALQDAYARQLSSISGVPLPAMTEILK